MTANGRVPAGSLVTVQGSIQLSRPTANAWDSMRSTAAREGHPIAIAAPAGGYRSYAVQADMRSRPWLYNLSKVSSVKLAAPGNSTHGFGTAVDVVGDVGWAIRNAGRWGFSRPFGSADPNHFQHDGHTATASGGAVQPIHELTKEHDMTFMYTPKNRTGAAGSPHAFVLAWLDLPNGKLYEFDSENPNDLNIAYGIFGMHGVNYVPGGFGGSWNPVDAPGKVSAAQYDAIKRLWNSQVPSAGSGDGTAGASKADVDAAADRIIAQVPPAVIVEQKKPGN